MSIGQGATSDAAGANSDGGPRLKRVEFAEVFPDAGRDVVEPPVLVQEAYYGPLGSLVLKLAPHTEANPAAMLIQGLAGVGNIVGRHSYGTHEADHHYPNLYMVVVGISAKGRKGLGWRLLKARLFPLLDKGWANGQVLDGVASGEGLIGLVRDGDEDDPGVLDKRLMIVEEEFAGLLKVANKRDSKVSATLRQAWDSGQLSNLAMKNRTKSGKPLQATGAHFSVIGHITRDELVKVIDGTEVFNGFANRFLWVYSERSRRPLGKSKVMEVDVGEECKRILRGVVFARRGYHLVRDEEAEKLWCSYEGEFLEEKPHAVWGNATSRIEAQIFRLSIIFALIDCSETIRAEHVAAAKAVWDYCDLSARWAFCKFRFSPVAQKILDTVRTHGAMTLQQLNDTVFQRNLPRDEISRAIRELGSLVYLTQWRGVAKGRPTTLLNLSESINFV
jgi:Protein of unknown function (DUF3987)